MQSSLNNSGVFIISKTCRTASQFFSHSQSLCHVHITRIIYLMKKLLVTYSYTLAAQSKYFVTMHKVWIKEKEVKEDREAEIKRKC